MAVCPFQVGDELVSLDGVAVADLIQQFIPYAVNGSGNQISRQRLAAGTITQREQDFYPDGAPDPRYGHRGHSAAKRRAGDLRHSVGQAGHTDHAGWPGAGHLRLERAEDAANQQPPPDGQRLLGSAHRPTAVGRQ